MKTLLVALLLALGIFTSAVMASPVVPDSYPDAHDNAPAEVADGLFDEDDSDDDGVREAERASLPMPTARELRVEAARPVDPTVHYAKRLLRPPVEG